MNESLSPDNAQDDKALREERKAAQAAADRARARKASMRSNLKYLGFIAVAAAVVIGIVLLSKGAATPSDPAVLPDDIASTEWQEGNPASNVVLVEYADFQCPACAGINPIVRQVMEEYGDEILLVFRHLPLTSIHENAEEGAWAAEAAGKQGKFFEMGNMLFARQSEWTVLGNPIDAFKSYATSLGIDADQFVTDYQSSEVHQAVAASLKSARDAGLGSTPTFFLNGRQMQNVPRDMEVWRALLEDALAETAQNPIDDTTPATEDAASE